MWISKLVWFECRRQLHLECYEHSLFRVCGAMYICVYMYVIFASLLTCVMSIIIESTFRTNDSNFESPSVCGLKKVNENTILGFFNYFSTRQRHSESKCFVCMNILFF